MWLPSDVWYVEVSSNDDGRVGWETIQYTAKVFHRFWGLVAWGTIINLNVGKLVVTEIHKSPCCFSEFRDGYSLCLFNWECSCRQLELLQRPNIYPFWSLPCSCWVKIPRSLWTGPTMSLRAVGCLGLCTELNFLIQPCDTGHYSSWSQQF